MEVIKINAQSSLLKKHRLSKELLIIVSFILLSLISVILLLKTHAIYKSLDLQFHFRRIIELRESMLHGNILPDYSFNEFNGSAIMLSYPYFNLLPAILLSFIVKSKITLVYLFLMFNTLLTFLVSFYSSRNYTHKTSTAYVFSIIYSLSNVFLAYNVITTDLGIVSSYTFLPLVVFAFIRLLKKENSWIELSIGMSLIAFSHFLNLFIISVFLLVWLLINWKRLDKKIWIEIAKAIGLFILLTSVIWIPFIHFYSTNLGNVSSPVSLQLYGINLKTFFSGIYGSKNYESVGFFSIIAIFISIFYYKRFNHFNRQMYWLSIAIVALVLFFPWNITAYGFMKVLNHFQFTFRFLILPQMLLSFIFALIITQYIHGKKSLLLSAISIIIAVGLQIVMGQYTLISHNENDLSITHYLDRSQKKTDLTKIKSYQINKSAHLMRFLDYYYNGDDDYIPKDAASIAGYVNDNKGLYNGFRPILVNNANYNQLSFNGGVNMNRISLPIYLYNNEKLNVYLNGHKVDKYADQHSLLTVDNAKRYVHEHKQNTVTLKPKTNMFRVTGAILSLIGIALAIIIVLRRFIM